MNVYMFQAALFCESCGEEHRNDLDAAGKTPCAPDNESSFDSDDYPKGAYSDGGGEADCPQHCDACGVFLENPLTSEGYDYVREAIEESRAQGKVDGARAVITEWAAFYEID